MLLVSSELPELLALSDRILVMRKGEVVREFARGEAIQDEILHAALIDGAGAHA
jgi:ribose transport system ATP-binding protein